MLKRIFFLANLLLSISIVSKAQIQGCTDPQAGNYAPSATVNNGTCTYPVTHYTPVLRANFPSLIPQSSGLEWTDGKLWTHNDGGSSNDIFSVDTTTGQIIQKVYIDNYPNTDWEDITADSSYIYVGDFGNNNGTRTDLKILKIKKSDITTGSTVHLNAQAIRFNYTDQTVFTSSSTHNFDCEALVSIRDSLYIFTKDRGDLATRVYKLPKVPGNYHVSPHTNYPVDGLITGADYNPLTQEVVLIGYLSGHTNPFLWFLNDFRGDLFFSGNKRRIEIGSGQQWQTEGITCLPNNRFFISCENAGTIQSSIWLSHKPLGTINPVIDVSDPTISMYPNPTSDLLQLDHLTDPTPYQLWNLMGQCVQSGVLNSANNILNLQALPAGIYLLGLKTKNGMETFLKAVKE